MKYNSLLIKVVASCNLRCRYCYWHPMNQTRRLETIQLNLAKDLIHQYILANTRAGHNEVTVIFHGGEPLLAGRNFYTQLLRHQRAIAPPGIKVVTGLQTNGTLIDDSWAEFFREENFVVGVSLDGPEFIHNHNRLTAAGHGSFAHTLRGIEKLKKAGVLFGVSCVVSKDSLPFPDEIFSFFCQLRPQSLDLLPTDIVGDLIDQSRLGAFLIRFFDLWFDSPISIRSVRMFQSIINLLLGGEDAICTFECECTSNLACDHLGNLYPCDYYVGDYRWTFGNIREVSLEDLEHNPIYIDFHRKAQPAPKCRTCPYFHACGGGCSNRRLALAGTFQVPDVYCEARKILIDHIADRLAARIRQTTQRGDLLQHTAALFSG